MLRKRAETDRAALKGSSLSTANGFGIRSKMKSSRTSALRLWQEPRRPDAVPLKPPAPSGVPANEDHWSKWLGPLSHQRGFKNFIIHAYVALDKPDAAGRLAIRTVTMVEALKPHLRLGNSDTFR
jgi:hypothetical protein